MEKDIWVVWALSTLFTSPLGTHLVFKGGTALSKAYKAIRRFSEDVDLTYDIRALSRHSLSGMLLTDWTRFPRAGAKRRSGRDEIRKELLPAWLRDSAHPIVQAGLAGLPAATSRVTDGCIFIDYKPVVAASSYALPRVMLEFGARSTGEPTSCTSGPLRY